MATKVFVDNCGAERFLGRPAGPLYDVPAYLQHLRVRPQISSTPRLKGGRTQTRRAVKYLVTDCQYEYIYNPGASLIPTHYSCPTMPTTQAQTVPRLSRRQKPVPIRRPLSAASRDVLLEYRGWVPLLSLPKGKARLNQLMNDIYTPGMSR